MEVVQGEYAPLPEVGHALMHTAFATSASDVEDTPEKLPTKAARDM